jgi:hypothetical protein
LKTRLVPFRWIFYVLVSPISSLLSHHFEGLILVALVTKKAENEPSSLILFVLYRSFPILKKKFGVVFLEDLKRTPHMAGKTSRTNEYQMSDVS